MQTLRKRSWMLTLLLAAALALAGCASGDGPLGQPLPSGDETPPKAAQSALPSPIPGGPEDLAVSFYTAYVQALENMQPAIGNPEFEAQRYLSEDYLVQVAEIRAGFDGAGFDPILQAQAVPPGPVEVKESHIEGDQATVTLQFGRTVLEQPWERIVSLEQIDGEWLIVPDRVEGGGKSPAETVQAFYDWYLEYMRGSGTFRNPLVDRAYRAAPYLDGRIIQQVDQLVEAGLIYDPFLCAQDAPQELHPLASYANSARPIVVMESSFAGHFLTADLGRANFNQWTIRNITCGATPAGLAKAFYTWALDEMTGSGEFRNPWAAGLHRDSPFLSQNFIQELDALLAGDQPIMADPVFLAQDLPAQINTAPCPEPDCALVLMQFGEAAIRQLEARMIVEDGRLKIDSIRHPVVLESREPDQPVAGVDHWAPFLDEQYGYAFRYPAGWTVKTDPVSSLHNPQDYPLVRSTIFSDPQAGSEIAPLRVDVVIGDQETALAMVGGALVEEIQINGYPAAIYRSEPGIITCLLQHPDRPDIWLIFNDPLTQFPGREAQAASATGVFEAAVSTIGFSQQQDTP